MHEGSPSAPAIDVQGLSKAFRIPHEQVHTLKERALHPTRRRSFDRLQALKDVSFQVRTGEVFGIVGRNGSGKSTLLKCLAGTYQADAGEIWLRGRVAAFIELGVGFNPDLTSRDNVLINGIMLGLSPAEARARYGAVLDFAGLREFSGLKLKNYSSGMQVRLAFAVMVQVDADLLLIDEVLAVGDAAFQQKCFNALGDLRAQGRTIVLVTHDMRAVERFCDRAMLVDRGEVVQIGSSEEIARRYNELNFDYAEELQLAAGATGSAGDGCAAIVDAWFEDESGIRTAAVEHGRACSFHQLVEARMPIEDPVLGFTLHDDRHRDVFATNTLWTVGAETGALEPGERIELCVRFDNLLAPGRYFASPAVTHGPEGIEIMDLRVGLAPLVVTGDRAVGLVALPHEVSLERPGTTVGQRAQ